MCAWCQGMASFGLGGNMRTAHGQMMAHSARPCGNGGLMMHNCPVLTAPLRCSSFGTAYLLPALQTCTAWRLETPRGS